MLGKAPRRADNSYFDRDFEVKAVKIFAGEYYATADATAISTLLGSCVSVCLFDRKNSIGGMNHFMLPQLLAATNASRCSPPYGSCPHPCSTRYGECAFKHLLEQLQALGAQRANLEAKLFGAGRVIEEGPAIGRMNAEFALGYLKERSIPIVAADLGESCGRKLIFFPATGKAYVKRLASL